MSLIETSMSDVVWYVGCLSAVMCLRSASDTVSPVSQSSVVLCETAHTVQWLKSAGMHRN